MLAIDASSAFALSTADNTVEDGGVSYVIVEQSTSMNIFKVKKVVEKVSTANLTFFCIIVPLHVFAALTPPLK